MVSRKTALRATALLVLGIPIVIGVIRTPKILAETSQKVGAPFEITSVQSSTSANEGTGVRFAPGRLTIANWTTMGLIKYAYGTIHTVGGPAWMDTERYIIDVKVDDSRAYESGKLVDYPVGGGFPLGLRHKELQSVLQSLLVDRFGLKLSHETKQLPVYNLVIAESGLKIHEATPGDTYANGIIGADGLPAGPHAGSGQDGHLAVQALPMSTLADTLSQQLGLAVVDRTGLTGDYDFTLDWTPGATSDRQGVTNSSGQESSPPAIFTAIEQQLGLKLELQDVPTDFLVIEQAQKPRGI